MAISAVDIALWDLKVRLLGVALSGLLGRARDAVPVYGSGGFTSYPDERTRDQASGWVDKQRIPRVKIKIGESWGGGERRDLARVRLAREVIGPDAELYVDANGGYTAGQAVRVAAGLDACGVTAVVQPHDGRLLRRRRTHLRPAGIPLPNAPGYARLLREGIVPAWIEAGNPAAVRGGLVNAGPRDVRRMAVTAQDHVTQRVRIVMPPWGRPPARAAVRRQKWDHMLSWISLAIRSRL